MSIDNYRKGYTVIDWGNSDVQANTIPPMTHELSSGWRNNPKIENIIINDETATMSRKDFDILLDYSSSVPSGVYEGKMWKNYAPTDEECNRWYLNWWGSSDDPNKCSHNKRRIVLKKGDTYEQSR